MGNIEKSTSKVRKYLMLAIKTLLALGIVLWMIKGNYANFKEGIKVFNYYWLLPAFVIYFSHLYFSGWRWYKLAKMLNVKMSKAEALAVNFQGYFWSLIIPGGAIGGDVAKVAIISRRQPVGSKAEGVLSILMDRMIGMVALFALTLVLIVISLPQLMAVEKIGSLELSESVKVIMITVVALLCLGGIVAMLMLFFHRQLQRLNIVAKLFQLGNRYSHGMIDRMTSALDLYAKNYKQLCFLTLFSVLFIHIMTVGAVICVICGLGISNIPYQGVLTAVMIGNIVGLIPFTISGIGLRDVTMLTLLLAAGMAGDAVIVPVIYSMIVIGANVFCAIFFIFDKGSKG